MHRWHDLGPIEELRHQPLRQITVGRTRIALSWQDGREIRLIRLNDLKFRACEGYYSKSAHACTWPCSITQMDPHDQMDAVYEGIVHWADVILLTTPIRWGSAELLLHDHHELVRVERAGRKGAPAEMPESPARVAAETEAI
ncbi:MAG: hypothetical protein ACJ759_07015 [Thermoanaerobaculia bacterium]